MAFQSSLDCPSLSDVVESSVIRSLCPQHLSQFIGFRRNMQGLRVSLNEDPPSEDEEAEILSVCTPSYKKKIDEQGWKKLADIIENPLGERIANFCYGWPQYGLSCCNGCSQCSVYCDSNQLQGAYALIRDKVIHGSDDMVEMKKAVRRNPPLLQFKEDYLQLTDKLPDQVFGDNEECHWCRNRHIVFPVVSPTPAFRSDSEDENNINPFMDDE